MNYIKQLNNLRTALDKIGKYKTSRLIHSFAQQIIKEADGPPGFNTIRQRTDYLKTTLNKLSSLPNVYFHMAELNKLGINPGSSYNTPIGICMYPLNQEFANMLLNDSLPFVGNQEYIHFAQVKNPDNILRFEDGSLSDQQYENLTQKIFQWWKSRSSDSIDDDEVMKKFMKIIVPAEINSNLQNNAGKLWNVTREISGNAKAWTNLLHYLGFYGADDTSSCFGIIHPAEPCQAIFFSSAYLNHLATEYNPHSKQILEGYKGTGVHNEGDKNGRVVFENVENFAERYPEQFLIKINNLPKYKTDKKYKRLIEKALEKWSDQNPWLYLVSDWALMPEYKSFTDKAVIDLAKTDYRDFLNSSWAEMPEYSSIKEEAIEQWADGASFLKSKWAKMPEYRHLVVKQLSDPMWDLDSFFETPFAKDPENQHIVDIAKSMLSAKNTL